MLLSNFFYLYYYSITKHNKTTLFLQFSYHVTIFEIFQKKAKIVVDKSL